MDYGSDLDLLVVFDDARPWPPLDGASNAEPALCAYSSPQEFYARVTSQLVSTLGSITREGMIYRVDLRLRPEGKNGPLARGLSSLVWYIANRASAWEHSAYLKVREVAGCSEFGGQARKAICEACFDAASQNKELKQELREMRLRLEREKARGDRSNIKWGPGGMTDAYFITRYLQLAHRSYFPPEHGTSALIAYLAKTGALREDSSTILLEGYTFLRTLDHWVRLLTDLPAPRLPASTAALRDICRAMGYQTIEDVESELATRTARMRQVFNETFSD
jgi:glutamate-ammonia-ligase adenylyltransferase